MLTYIFFIINITIFFLIYKQEKSWINPVTVLMTPYSILIFFNNTYLYKLGFYKIKDELIIMYIVTFLFFFLGTRIAVLKEGKYFINEKENRIRIGRYNIKLMVNILLLIGILGGIKLFYAMIYIKFQNFEGVMGNGIVGHLLLFSSSILPIVTLSYMEKKKIKTLISIFLILMLLFSTFIKYNVIGPIVNIFIFLGIYKKSMLKKSIIFLIIIVPILFIINYFIGFWILGIKASNEFYIFHFFKYIFGSIINSNNIFINGINKDVTLIQKLLIFVFALPNMFLHKFFQIKFYSSETIMDFSFREIGNNNQMTNVIDAIGFLYPSSQNLGAIIIYFIFVMLAGYIFYILYLKNIKKKYIFNTFNSNLMTYFLFFSFFGTFYINPGPWEILVYSIISQKLFLKKTTKKGRK